jgi:hypothetical protein
VVVHKKSIGGGKREDRIDLANMVFPPTQVVTRDCREDSLIPERQPAGRGIGERFTDILR